jgi:hypothetical protein
MARLRKKVLDSARASRYNHPRQQPIWKLASRCNSVVE